MRRFILRLFLTFATMAFVNGQTPVGRDDVIRVGPGVTAPRLLRKTDPRYSDAARADRIQGTVMLQIVVNEKGRTADITVLSPLGYGLDEQAIAAVERWEFAPGMKNGSPVKILATVQVNFKFPEIRFDEVAERERTTFNVAMQVLQRTGTSPQAMEARVKDIQDLARKGYPPALYFVGVWETTGEHVAKDPADGLALIERAAEKDYGPALMQVATRQIEGRDLPKDPEKGMKTMRQASMLGSAGAQFYLGDLYEKGLELPAAPEKARQYFRLCAAKGVSLCQYRLGSLLLNAPGRAERDYVQAVAWLQLAADQNLPEAKEIAVAESAGLTPAQTAWMTTLKGQLTRK